VGTVIAFTGHRDRTASWHRFQVLAEQYPQALWLHGGANGFDAQVKAYVLQRGIAALEWRPDYKHYPPKLAPIVRNFAMIDWRPDLLVTLWDGRRYGGTWRTRQYALDWVLRPEQVIDWPTLEHDPEVF
jgi:hypothetical protein